MPSLFNFFTVTDKHLAHVSRMSHHRFEYHFSLTLELSVLLFGTWMSYFMDSSSEESCCEEAVSGSTLTKMVEEKAKRKTKVPLKLKDYVQEKESLQKQGVIVKCSQTGRKIKTKVQNITKNDMSPIVIDDFKKGSSLLVEVNGKPYPVEFMAFMEDEHSSLSQKKNFEQVGTSKGLAKRTTLEEAKRELEPKNGGPLKKKSKTMLSVPVENNTECEDVHNDPDVVLSPLHQSTDTNLLIIIDKKLDAILERINRIEERLEPLEGVPVSTLKTVEKDKEDNKYMVNGINILHVPAGTPHTYGRMLLDMLFTRSELKDSIVFTSVKSTKPPLDRKRVDLLISCVSQRFPDFNQRELIRNLNQKCRDSVKLKEAVI